MNETPSARTNIDDNFQIPATNIATSTPDSTVQQTIAQYSRAQNILVQDGSTSDHPPQDEQSSKSSCGNRYTNAQKIQALTLHSMGIKVAEIERLIGVKPRAVYNSLRVAKNRGWDPHVDFRILDKHVVIDLSTRGRKKRNRRVDDQAGAPEMQNASPHTLTNDTPDAGSNW